MITNTELGPARTWQAAWATTAATLADHSFAERFAAHQGFVLRPDQARLFGVDGAELRRLVRTGRWSTPRRGVLSVLPAPDPDAETPHGLRPEVRAAAATLTHERSLISHGSAGLAYGLPVLRKVRRATLTTSYRCEACSRADVVVHAAAVSPEESTWWFGVPILTVARTVVDLARTGVRDGLVAADAALHERLVTMAELTSAVERAYRWHGVQNARRVLELAEPAVESPLESLVRLFLAAHGIPLPDPQAWVPTRGGRYRVDGLWADRAVILEADGLLKYRARDDALNEEKLRQEWLEQAGYRVVRVTWWQLHHEPELTEFRIRRALALGGASCSRA